MLTEGYDQGSPEIEADFEAEVASGPQSEPPTGPDDDTLEHWFVDRGYSVKQLAKRFHVSEDEVRDRLLGFGLEVEGKARDGLELQSDALPPTQYQQYACVEDCFVDWFQKKGSKERSVRKGPIRV